MATLHEVEGRPTLYAKGAIEQILPACDKLLTADGHAVHLDAAGAN